MIEPTNIHYPRHLFEQFSDENDKLAGIEKPIPHTSDYHKKTIKEAVEKGLKQIPLTLEDLSRWHGLIVSERIQHKCPIQESAKGNENALEMQKLIDKINEKVLLENYPEKDSDRVSLIAEIFCEFEHLELFAEAHHSLARLVVNYMNSRLFTPIFIFKHEEKNALEKSINNVNDAKLYFASKVKEMAFDQFFNLLPFSSSSGDSYTFKAKNHGITIEFHELARSEKKWQI